MILKSRAFWTAVVDAVLSLIILAIGISKPELKDLAITIIGYIQPIILMLIAAFTVEGTVKVWALLRAQQQGVTDKKFFDLLGW